MPGLCDMVPWTLTAGRGSIGSVELKTEGRSTKGSPPCTYPRDGLLLRGECCVRRALVSRVVARTTTAWGEKTGVYSALSSWSKLARRQLTNYSESRLAWQPAVSWPCSLPPAPPHRTSQSATHRRLQMGKTRAQDELREELCYGRRLMTCLLPMGGTSMSPRSRCGRDTGQPVNTGAGTRLDNTLIRTNEEL